MDVFTACVKAAVATLYPEYAEDVTLSQGKNGDFSTSCASKILSSQKCHGASDNNKSSDIAHAIVSKMIPHPIIGKIEVAPSGHINLYYSTEYLIQRINGPYQISSFMQGKRILIDYSSPNIAKEMHVGHLRSTILGQSLSRILSFCGADVSSVNHVGDWGTQFGMLIAQIKDKAVDITTLNLSQVQTLYRDAKKRFDDDASFAQQSRHEVVLLQSGDRENIQLWRHLCSVSMNAFNDIYQRLDVSIPVRGESTYNDMIPDVLKDLESKGLITIHQGAKCFYVDGLSVEERVKMKKQVGPPLLLQKSDGGYSYDTTDMAALRYRMVDQKFDRVLYVVDAAQNQHFDQLFQAGRKAGYIGEGQEAVHISFGAVLGPDGKRFKTRSGDTVRLVDLLDQATTRSEALYRSKHPDSALDDASIRNIAEKVGLACIRYADLQNDRISDYTFSFDRMLDYKGKTGAYLLYAYARIRSIFRSANRTTFGAVTSLEHPAEVTLVRKCIQFEDRVRLAASEYAPNIICVFLYDLAEVLTGFYRDCRVLGDPRQEDRLSLLYATSKIMQTGFDLLGIECLESM